MRLNSVANALVALASLVIDSVFLHLSNAYLLLCDRTRSSLIHKPDAFSAN
jgi:hypothetical protein